jgi:hypothetical protein
MVRKMVQVDSGLAHSPNTSPATMPSEVPERRRARLVQGIAVLCARLCLCHAQADERLIGWLGETHHTGGMLRARAAAMAVGGMQTLQEVNTPMLHTTGRNALRPKTHSSGADASLGADRYASPYAVPVWGR